jgi:hypothetical protein
MGKLGSSSVFFPTLLAQFQIDIITFPSLYHKLKIIKDYGNICPILVLGFPMLHSTLHCTLNWVCNVIESMFVDVSSSYQLLFAK